MGMLTKVLRVGDGDGDDGGGNGNNSNINNSAIADVTMIIMRAKK